MTRALLYKEFRETIGIAAIGLVAFFGVALGWHPFPVTWFGFFRQGTIPFVSDQFTGNFAMISSGLAIALGLRQSIGDFFGDGQLFLLHRPVPRGRIYGLKLLVGVVATLVCGIIPIAIYALWAASPGTHASPFEWSMAAPACAAWVVSTCVYFGAFLSGVRPAAWIGTRLMPLAAAAVAAVLLSLLWLPLVVAIALAVDAVLAFLILAVARSREFA